MSYISPIEIYEGVQKEILKKREECILNEIEKTMGVIVDKDELIKALEYDRNQYTKGYIDGTEKVGIVHCKDCKYWDRDLKCVQDLGDHVGVCMQAKWFCGEEGYCLYGTKKEEE